MTNRRTATIGFKSKPLHNQNYYLDTDFEGIDLSNAGRIFEEIAQRLDKPLQVMISSEEVNKIAMLEAAGFLCKRKCYEIEAQKRDYVGEDCEGEILYSHVGEEVAYVYGESVQEFRGFSQALVSEMFRKSDVI